VLCNPFGYVGEEPNREFPGPTRGGNLREVQQDQHPARGQGGNRRSQPPSSSAIRQAISIWLPISPAAHTIAGYARRCGSYFIL